MFEVYAITAKGVPVQMRLSCSNSILNESEVLGRFGEYEIPKI